MDNLITLFTEIEHKSIALQKEEIEKIFSLFYHELVDKSTPEFNWQKDFIAHKINILLKSEIYADTILEEINKRFSYDRTLNDYDEIIVHALVSSETNAAISILKDIVKSESCTLKAYIYYHRVCYPIPKIFQSLECKLSIIDFINSEQFPCIYKERCNWPGYHSKSFAFPNHYTSCFNIKEFDQIKETKFSASKLSKLASKERLESIRLIRAPFFKLVLILKYYNSLPTLYQTRFVRLVDKTFPELELKKNGHSVYTRYL